MSAIDDKPTLGERYSSATESSNLKLSERRGDVDIVIAAGLGGDGLAGVLYRLQVEYDAVRADHRAAELTLRNRLAAADRKTGDKKQQEIQAAEGAALTEHLLILTHIRSLTRAKDMFGEFAIVEATRQQFMRPDRDALAIARRVLDVWLRPQCNSCDGRGFNGATHRGEMQTLCRPCKGSGHRRDEVGKDDAERRFAAHLSMQIDAKLHQAQRDMRANLGAVGEAKDWIAERSGVAL